MRALKLREMLQTIEQEARLTASRTGRSSFAPQVMRAMKLVPRDAFVPLELHSQAFVNGPLPIGQGQTISQPYIVALMTDLLEPQLTQTILEIGTGSGYQAAILAQLVQQVYSLEIIPSLATQAAERLSRLDYHNIEIRTDDGHRGWPEHAPYDGIIVTAAATHLPQALLEQLKPGGRLVIPIGLPGITQELLLVEKNLQGDITTQDLLSVVFVPMTSDPPNIRDR
ncbi:protein-L-isoaspartate(D-aspartate) O-methyltransferase [Geopsychrobacter electrodiphilus]|uniref:protein-L-isoaspartate(D-aspartate) O-methyltransferase n=1 Tax=Geopsychrobacter electrodiphilus TaxID=225196 RepID=UPI000373E905|nr:protein-L-isoaspartate(D-aspartate) O-methyltransferase [Geopsychrobacter electrodiphilus]